VKTVSPVHEVKPEGGGRDLLRQRVVMSPFSARESARLKVRMGDRCTS